MPNNADIIIRQILSITASLENVIDEIDGCHRCNYIRIKSILESKYLENKQVVIFSSGNRL